VNHEESEHDEIDGTKLGAETTKQGAIGQRRAEGSGLVPASFIVTDNCRPATSAVVHDGNSILKLLGIITARCTLAQTAVLRSHVVLSVCDVGGL